MNEQSRRDLTAAEGAQALDERALRQRAYDAAQAAYDALRAIYEAHSTQPYQVETRQLYHMREDAQAIVEQMQRWLDTHPPTSDATSSSSDDTASPAVYLAVYLNACEDCVFLGGYDRPLLDEQTGARTGTREYYDLYLHAPADGGEVRVVCRYGHETYAFLTSTPAPSTGEHGWYRSDPYHPILEASRRAHERALIFTPETTADADADADADAAPEGGFPCV